MPYRIDIYIGSDNGSGRIDGQYLGKVRRWADTNFPDGYTLLRGEGCYRGTYEDSILVNVLSNDEFALKESLQRLKKELDQEAILFARSLVELEVV